MPGMMGFNPYGGYGQPQSYMPQTAQMAAQQAYAQQMQSMPQIMPQAQPGVTVRLVTSRDEATTAQIPFDATINVFVNMGAGEIYIKRFNPNTGGASTSKRQRRKSRRRQQKRRSTRRSTW